jgi:hypothetical protein
LRKRTINLALLLAGLILVFLTFIPLFLSYYLGPAITQQILAKQVEKLLRREVEVEGAGITILGGFGIKYKNMRIPGPGGEEFFRAETFLLKPRIKSLVLGRLRWKRVVLENPSIHLIRTPDGQFNFVLNRKKTSDEKDEGFFQKLRTVGHSLPSQLVIRGGKIQFTDFRLTETPLVTQLEAIKLTFQHLSPEIPFSFFMTGSFVGETGKKFSVSTRVTRLDTLIRTTEPGFQIDLKAKGIESRRIWPYLWTTGLVEDLHGLLDLKIMVREGPKASHSSGEVKIRDGRLTIPALYNAPIEPGEMVLSYDLAYEKDEIHLSQLTLRLPYASIKGSGSIYELSSDNRSISLELSSERTSLEHLRPYLPDRIIPGKLLVFLGDSGAQGSVWVKNARFHGRLTDFTSEKLQKNPQTLSIRVRLDKGRFLLDSELPAVKHISGTLTVDGDQAAISDVHGEFGNSRVGELEGAISHLYSNPQMALTFKGDLDLGDLGSLLKTRHIPREVRRDLSAIRRISGKAKMTGEIRHRFNKKTALTYKGQISVKGGRAKLAGLPFPVSNVEGEIQYNEKAIHISHAKWKMGNSLFHGVATFRGYLGRLWKKTNRSQKLKIDFEVDGEKILIDQFLSQDRAKPKIKPGPRSTWGNSAISGKVSVSKGSFKGFRFKNLTTSFTVKRGLLRFRRFQAEAPGGFLRCRGWINLKSDKGVSFKLIPTLHQLDMTNAIPILSNNGKTPVLYGSLNLDGILTGHGDSLRKITESLRGDLRFRAENGNIQRFKSSQERGLPYKRVTAKILVHKGVATTTDLHLDSDAVSMSIRGHANLNDQTLDLRIGIRPLQTVDKILRNVPVAGWLLAGKDRSILTFSYRVSGPFNDLKVESQSVRGEKPMGP